MADRYDAGSAVTLSAQTEVGELSEGASGESSTMPQKRNPIISQRLVRSARTVRTCVDLVLDVRVLPPTSPLELTAQSAVRYTVAPNLDRTAQTLVTYLSDLGIVTEAYSLFSRSKNRTNSSAETAGLTRCPWRSSHPSALRKSACSTVSTPSATTPI